MCVCDKSRIFLDGALGGKSRRTGYDINGRLTRFAEKFAGRLLHEITAAEVEEYLAPLSPSNRWGMAKRLKPFFKFAKRRKWVAENVMEEVPACQLPTPGGEVYTVPEFHTLLWINIPVGGQQRGDEFESTTGACLSSATGRLGFRFQRPSTGNQEPEARTGNLQQPTGRKGAGPDQGRPCTRGV